MEKVVLFSFRGDPMCVIHVLLNGLDMKEKGFNVKIVIEGESTRLVPDFKEEGSLLYGPFKRAFGAGIIDGICRACSQKMGTLKEAEEMGIRVLSDMSGHPSMGRYMGEGYRVITF